MMTLEDYFKKALGEMQFNLLGMSHQVETLKQENEELKKKLNDLTSATSKVVLPKAETK